MPVHPGSTAKWRLGGLAKGKAAVGAGINSGCREDFDGIGFEHTVGFDMIGGSVNFSLDSNTPTGGSIQYGPQLGIEANATITGSLTARDLGRAVAALIHGTGGGKIIGE